MYKLSVDEFHDEVDIRGVKKACTMKSDLTELDKGLVAHTLSAQT
jgi:hypothetical protein